MGINDYLLLDCGQGRRLESFAGVVCNRPAPMAAGRITTTQKLWSEADLYFDHEKKLWAGQAPESWSVAFGNVRLKLEQASNGQVGVFPEQYENWEWIQNIISGSGRKIKLLNLFAHTGGSTIAAALAGAEVCHLDAAASANTRARVNAGLSECHGDSVRWITEDALRFVSREVKRGNKYDAIILDPPAFGRMKKKIWKFEKCMPELLELTVSLLSDEPLFLLLTSHNTGWNAADQSDFVRKYAPALLSGDINIGAMKLRGNDCSLSLGVYLRVEYM